MTWGHTPASAGMTVSPTMSDPIIDRLDQIKGRADKAADHVGKIAAREHRWTMSVPPRETDTDILLTQCLDTDVPRMEAALREVLDLHVPHEGYNGEVLCSECHDNTGMFWDYPCDTVRAITGKLGVKTEGEEK